MSAVSHSNVAHGRVADLQSHPFLTVNGRGSSQNAGNGYDHILGKSRHVLTGL